MKRFSLAILALVVATGAQAASEKVEMNLVTSQGVGQSIGSVTITETDKGLEFSPDLKAFLPVNMASIFMPKEAASQPPKMAKPAPQNPQAGILIHKIPVNMKGQKVPGI
ncbi:hypothetical protein JMT78AECX_JMT78AEC_04043 [Escherichia coli]|nr:hypothetical protein JMT78AECX_JMT78AEC_04043 [Escherichia coli]